MLGSTKPDFINIFTRFRKNMSPKSIARVCGGSRPLNSTKWTGKDSVDFLTLKPQVIKIGGEGDDKRAL